MSNPSTPRSRSRSKRSTTNLSNLRLAPLSTKFAEPSDDVGKGPKTPKSPYADDDATFTRQHPSYLQGRSAPTTPGILSRSSSRKHLGGGLSRRVSIYDDDNALADGDADAEDEVQYTYNANARSLAQNRGRADFGSGNIPKAKSEAAITAQRHGLSGQGVPLRKHGNVRRPKSGIATPRHLDDDDWLRHTGSTAAALVQEGKGQIWRSSTNLTVPESEDDEDDDRYEEMARLSASTAKLQLGQFEGPGSPVLARSGRSASNWGSRYGSRNASQRTSRIASPVGTRTPRRAQDVPGYFDTPVHEAPAEDEVAFAKPREESDEYEDRAEVDKLSQSNSFGLGSVVDKLMNFNLFKNDEGAETTDDDLGSARRSESPDEARNRMTAEMERRREEKERLAAQPRPAPMGDGKDGKGEVGGWTDAAWLLSVASKAMF
ncbi:hypothetical protein CLAFUW4_13525 [Fulvia fulva]|uniref:Uncharacterized protein n=1 Tax=Passalora fulva TaxID=5499 RepID=A0A9Q8PL88_PASFU|nr:uncharacterized protein CLAFUR5_13376 [Fulvia fulva]KAK4610472.1 hypothetical protein CLAFUR4_13527 [Fulvia fulva]KAK4611006.1 hypothetical protein CLAFUR0_13536 [Fulvia fulva]UJO24674.1 hypothetical protein CLAFUR5_13376 [Fulvia fulva]WPV22124.1 hypothetical protein CLAFUW4_13525 [Fulvia fulva]WPV37205.1 hypothetical protein CLAFUW7_13532 [Fulvia fulva]